LLERLLLGGMRAQSEIIGPEQEFYDRRWYDRHLLLRQRYKARNGGRATEGIYERALRAAEEIRALRPDLRPVEDDFESGM
jgi:hypothetical protein